MEKKNRRSNRKRGGKKLRDPNKIPKTIKGLVMKRSLTFTDSISCVSASNSYVFGLSGAAYSNIWQLLSGSEFASLQADYQAFRMISLQVEVTRVLSDVALNTCFPNGVPTLGLVYYPTLQSVNLGSSTVLENDSIQLVSPFDITIRTKNHNVPNIDCVATDGTTQYIVNPSRYLATNFVSTTPPIYPGQISCATIVAANAAASKVVYQVKIIAFFEFAYPL